ncbi:MAG: hypothetical protein C5B49_04845 [Bdellovibrio sp.]|nr:MAG: hypothetical protein C5B49_04845 [Bdellovibrio sp.]
MKRLAENMKRLAPWAQVFRQELIRRPLLVALLFVGTSWWAISALVLYFESQAPDHNINSFGDSLWWGIVTLLTVGYGDKYPVSAAGRIAAGFLMVSGVVGIAIVTAKISSFFLERALRERRGFVDTTRLRNHFVICGWKNEMAEFLQHVLGSNRSLRDEDIVLLNNAAEDMFDAIRETPALKKIKIVKGDFFSEMNLRKVEPQRARKILILADATPNAKGEIPTITEADARTIMAAMTLNNLARGTPVAAELLDPQMESYLRLAQVNEIIFSRDYTRMIVALASTGTGVTNVFHDLISSKSPHFIGTEAIAEQFVRHKYGDLVQYYLQNRTGVELIGLLEYSGNSHEAKEKALRRAQHTTNIKELVSNLNAVKAMRFNQPKFCLPADYVIQEDTMAIVIENRGEIHVA